MRDDTRKVDTVLASWGRWIKAGHSVAGLGYPSMTPYARAITPTGSKPDVSVMEEVDIMVGRMNEPFQKVLRRHYIDQRPKGGFYSESRSLKDKARSERMPYTAFKTALFIARNRMAEKLEDLI